MEKSVGSCEPRQRWGLNGYLVYFWGDAGTLLAPVILSQVPFIPETFCAADMGVGKLGR